MGDGGGGMFLGSDTLIDGGPPRDFPGWELASLTWSPSKLLALTGPVWPPKEPLRGPMLQLRARFCTGYPA